MSVCVLAAAVFTAAALGDATTVKVRGTVTTASKESKATEWALWAQVGLAAVAALTLPAIFLQVRTGRKDAAADRTATLHSEFGHRNFQKVFSPSLAYLDLDLGDVRPLADKVRDCIEKIRAWETMPHAEAHRLPRTPRDPSSPHACKNDVDNIAGFFEVLSQRYNQKDIQRDSVARSMGPNLVVYFVTASWWIHWQRAAARENAVFGEWEQTVNALRHPRGRRFRPRHPTYAAITRVDPKLPIRAICVPPQTGRRLGR